MKLITEYCTEELTSSFVSYVTLKEVAHGMVVMSFKLAL